MFAELIEAKFADAPFGNRLFLPPVYGWGRINRLLQSKTWETDYLQIICCSDTFARATNVQVWQSQVANGDIVAVRSKRGPMGLLWVSLDASDDRESIDIRLNAEEYLVAYQRWRSMVPLSLGGLAVDRSLLLSAFMPVRLAFSKARSVRSASSPVPLWAVESPAAGTVGSCVKNVAGLGGVTIARHVWDDLGRPPTMLVDGKIATLVSEDILTDSCFLSVAGVVSPANLIGVSGPRRTFPSLCTAHEFDGARSGKAKVTLLGADPFCHTLIPGVQRKIWTSTAINSGDSGAALVDCASDEIVGFALAYGDPYVPGSYDLWIWADI